MPKLPEWVENPDPSIYLSDNYLVLDVENTIIDGDGSPLNGENSLLLSCYDYRNQRASLWGNEYDIQPLIERIYEVDFIVCHGGKHELQWLKRAGCSINHVLLFDTLLAEYVLNGNRTVGLKLSDISKRRGFGSKDPYVDLCMKDGICPSTLPKSWLERRCKLDVQQTKLIFLQQLEELVQQDKLKTLYTRCLLTPVLADIEFNGMHLDKERVDETYRDYVSRHVRLGEQLQAVSGGVNLRSPPQRAALIYDTLGFSEPTDRRGNPIRTPSGGRKTDSATLDQLTSSTNEQRAFTSIWGEYSKLGAALSKNLEFFKGVVDEKDCEFLGSFNQSVTATHRLSSSGRRTTFEQFPRPKSVQFQNMPRVFKSLFSARKQGWKIGEIDGAQLEFRVAAQLGRDAVALHDISSGVDVHRFSASVINKCAEVEVTINQRQDAKADTFKPLFGGTSGTVDQQRYYRAFQKKYKGITSWQEDNKFHVVQHKSLVIPSGLEFFWPDTRIEKGDYITNSTQICNYPVQSIATGDIIPIGLVKLWHEMKAREMESFLVNTIHDSAIVELHPEETELFAEVSSESFTTYVYKYLDVVYQYKWAVPLAAGLKIGNYWSEGEEVVYNSTPLYKLNEV